MSIELNLDRQSPHPSPRALIVGVSRGPACFTVLELANARRGSVARNARGVRLGGSCGEGFRPGATVQANELLQRGAEFEALATKQRA